MREAPCDFCSFFSFEHDCKKGFDQWERKTRFSLCASRCVYDVCQYFRYKEYGIVLKSFPPVEDFKQLELF